METILNQILDQFKVMEKRFDHADENISSINPWLSSLENQVTSVDNRLSSVESQITSMDNRLSSVESQITSMDNRLSSVESQITSMDNRLSSVESQITSVDNRLSSVENHVSSMDDSLMAVKDELHQLNEKTDHYGTEFRSYFKRIEGKLNDHESTFTVSSNQFRTVHVDIDHLSMDMGLHRKDIHQLKTFVNQPET